MVVGGNGWLVTDAGSVAAAHCYCQALPKEASRHSRAGSECAQSSHAGTHSSLPLFWLAHAWDYAVWPCFFPSQDSDNPDLRDRGYIYWRLLSTDPAAAKEVVLAEKPVISEETDLLEPTLLDELICHISTLASVYHKPPSAFVEGKMPVRKITLDRRPQQ